MKKTWKSAPLAKDSESQLAATAYDMLTSSFDEERISPEEIAGYYGEETPAAFAQRLRDRGMEHVPALENEKWSAFEQRTAKDNGFIRALESIADYMEDASEDLKKERKLNMQHAMGDLNELIVAFAAWAHKFTTDQKINHFAANPQTDEERAEAAKKRSRPALDEVIELWGDERSEQSLAIAKSDRKLTKTVENIGKAKDIFLSVNLVLQDRLQHEDDDTMQMQLRTMQKMLSAMAARYDELNIAKKVEGFNAHHLG